MPTMTRSVRRRGAGPIAAAVVVVAVGAAGCGGDAAPTRDQFVADFEQLCVVVEADIVDLADRFAEVEGGSADELDLVREQDEITRRFTDGIRALRPPPELDAEHRELIGLLDAADEALVVSDFDAVAEASTEAEAVIAAMGVEGC